MHKEIAQVILSVARLEELPVQRLYLLSRDYSVEAIGLTETNEICVRGQYRGKRFSFQTYDTHAPYRAWAISCLEAFLPKLQSPTFRYPSYLLEYNPKTRRATISGLSGIVPIATERIAA